MKKKPTALRQVRITQGSHQSEPTCDNCGLMSMRNFANGTTHRHCDIMGLFIPDEEMFPTCSLHTWQNRTSVAVARIGVKWEKGGMA